LEVVEEVRKRLVYLITLHSGVHISVALQALHFALQLHDLPSQVLDFSICFLELPKQLHRRHVGLVHLLLLLQQESCCILYLLPLRRLLFLYFINEVHPCHYILFQMLLGRKY
jgi:hypothetical protein